MVQGWRLLNICKEFTWQLQQTKFTVDVIVLSLVFCDLILGIQWLNSLGPILWDFSKLQMDFSIDGKRWGAKPSRIKLINNKIFTHYVEQSAQMCFLYMDSLIHHFETLTCNVVSSKSQLKSKI